MTQKHFVKAADQLLAVRAFWIETYGDAAYKALVNHVIDLCSACGPKFDVQKFRAYISTE